MRFTAVRAVEHYSVTDRRVTVDCVLDSPSEETDGDERTVPVTVEFLRPDSFRFRFEGNPEGQTAEGSDGSDDAGFARSVDLAVSESAGVLVLETAALRIEIGLGEWSFDVFGSDGDTLLSEQRATIGPTGVDEITPLGFRETEHDSGAVAVTECGTSFSLRHDDHVYGLGEKFTSLDKRGQSITSWTVKARGTETERSYKNVPFYLSTRGYGLLVETTNRVEFDVGDSTSAAMSVDVADDEFGFVFFGGPSFEDVLRDFTALTGRSPLPPTWSFGLWMSRAGYESRAAVEDVAERLREESIPCDVLHLDPQWMGLDSPTDLEWDREAFPDPESMLESLHEDGFRVSLWEHPYVAVGTETFAEAAAEGYLVADGTGDPYVLDNLVLDQARGGIVDFTNPRAVSWWQAKHRDLLAMGVDAFKTDFGEDVPRDGVFASGESGESVHNRYPNLYNEAVYDVLADVRGSDDAVTWGRSAWTGGQQYPLYWGGDPDASFEGMASALRGGLSLSLTGFPFWGHDIGGFWGEPSERLYVRWAQFGLLSSHARCHGVTPREPWQFGEAATRAFRKFARLRYRLFPYLYSLAAEATETGMPVVRPLVLEYQDDPWVHGVDDQFLLGSDLLVAPVLRADDTVDVYLPDDEWVDFWTGERIQGPVTLHREVPLDSMPLFVRAESVIPMADDEIPRTIEGLSGERSLRVTLSADGESRARGSVFDAAAGELREVVVDCDAERAALDCSIPDFEGVTDLTATVHGLATAPEAVSVNERTLPETDAESEGRGWYATESGTVRVRL